MKRSDLTPRQRAVVQATARVTLVLGGAGTGKTTVALWAARAALEASLKPSLERRGVVLQERLHVGRP